MRARNARLDRLKVHSPCPETWETMTGTGASRYCARCDKSVHDLALLPADAVERLIASQGDRLCARITRRADGSLVTLPPPAVSSFEGSRRVSSWVAALAAGLLGAPGALLALETAPPSAFEASQDPQRAEPLPVKKPEPPGVSLSGRLVDENGKPLAGAKITAANLFDGDPRETTTDADGRFQFVGLTSGDYWVEAELDGWDIEPISDLLLSSKERRDILLQGSREVSVTLGGVVLTSTNSLRDFFSESRVVVVATVIESAPFDREGRSLAVLSQLMVTAWIKGEAAADQLAVEHYPSAADDDDDEAELLPGSQVVAFLVPTDGGRYLPATWAARLTPLDEPTVAALRERLDALARLEPGTATYLDELLEWIVTTSEDPLTRSGALDDLAGGLDDLASFAEQRGISLEHATEDLQGALQSFLQEGGTPFDHPSPRLLAALLTDGQLARLTRALIKTRGLDEQSLTLHRIVHSWAPAEATRWLIERFKREPLEDPDLARQVVETIAPEVSGAYLAELASAVDDTDDGDDLTEALERFRRALP